VKLSRVKSIVLVAIAICVLAVASYSFAVPSKASAAPRRPAQYQVVRVDWEISAQELEGKLNGMAAQGWELHSIVTPLPGSGGWSHLIFRKAS
jgi:hypothetical protein